MKMPTSEQLQEFIDAITLANSNYIKIAVHYVGRNDSVYEACTHDVKALGRLAGYLTYLKASLERDNELLD